MSERTPAPASATDGAESLSVRRTRSDAGSDSARDADETRDVSSDRRNPLGDAVDTADEESPLRTATRLVRLLKLALGALVSLLTALKLLGFL